MSRGWDEQRMGGGASLVRAQELMRVPILSVGTNTPLLYALGRMDQSGYAQLPVPADGGQRLFGTLRGEDVRKVYRTLSDRQDVSDVRAELARIRVGEVCGPPLPVIPPTEGLSDILQRLGGTHAMLVAAEGGYGIITATDVLAHSRPLLFITELESHLRSFIESVLTKADEHWWMHRVPNEVRARCEGRLQAELSRVPPGLEHPPSSLLAFAGFGDYLTIILERRNWNGEFEKLFRSRGWVRTRLENVQEMRNAVAHSRRLAPDQVEVLELYVRELLRCMEPYRDSLDS